MGLWLELVELTSCYTIHHQHTACNITYDDTAQKAQLKQTDTSLSNLPRNLSHKVQFFGHSGAFERGLLKAVVWNNWSASSVFQQDIFLLLFISPMGGWGLSMWSSLSHSLSVSLMKLERGMRSSLSAACAAVGVSKSDVFTLPLVSSCRLN